MKSFLFIQLLHIFIIGAFLLYVGIYKTDIPHLLFPVMLGGGALVLIYHAYETYRKIQQNVPYWIHLIHVLFAAPLLIYIGYNGVNTERMYFELMLMLGFAVIGYHAYYMVSSALQ